MRLGSTGLFITGTGLKSVPLCLPQFRASVTKLNKLSHQILVCRQSPGYSGRRINLLISPLLPKHLSPVPSFHVHTQLRFYLTAAAYRTFVSNYLRYLARATAIPSPQSLGLHLRSSLSSSHAASESQRERERQSRGW